MKLQTIVRMQAITIGLGAALFLVTSAPAQEIDNTVWADDSSAASTTPAAPAITSDDLNITAANIQPRPASVDKSSVLANQASFSEVGPTNRWRIAFLLVCLGVVALYVRETAKRVQRKEPIDWKSL